MECFGSQKSSCRRTCEFYESCEICSKPLFLESFAELNEVDEPASESERVLDTSEESSDFRSTLFLRVLEIGDYKADRCMVIFAKACGFSYSETGLLLGDKSKQMIAKHVSAIGEQNPAVREALRKNYRCIGDTKLLKLERLFKSNIKKIRRMK